MKKIFTLFAALTCMVSMFAATETVYFVNASDWTGDIYFYTWEPEPKAWPGTVMTKEAEQLGGKDVYSFTAEAGNYTNVIFTNGSGLQTGNLTWTAGKYYVKDGWYTKEEAIAKLAQPVEYETVYFVNVQGWEKVNIYTWQPEVATWPGAEMKKEAEQLDGKDVYSYTYEKTAFGGMLFNGGDDSKKTGDLKWEAGKYFVKDTWYTKEELMAGAHNGPSVMLAGEFNSWNQTKMTVSADQKTAAITVALEVGTFMFKVVEEGEWLGNTGIMDRTNCTGWTFEKLDGGDETNCKIIADVAGDYVFTWTIADKKLSVTYPKAIQSAVDNVMVEQTTTKIIRNGQMYILREGVMYNALGQIAE